MRTIDTIKRILYCQGDRQYPIARNFLALGGKDFIECGDDASLDSAVRSLQAGGVPSKEVLILKKFMGRIFQRCPGTPGMICCNYMLMNTCFNCLYDCTYCFLNSYLNSYGIVQFINQDISFTEIGGIISSKRALRIGTGEFTDSLMMDEVTGIGARLIKGASLFKNVFLELKTKSNNISHLLAVPDKGNSVLAWSLNTEHNIALYENGTASLEERLRAAAAASREGYLVAFHFDPIILHEGWQAAYLDIVDRIFRSIDGKRIAWISLGCFRHSHGFKEIIRKMFPGEKLTLEEMFQGPDGKYRYLKQVRVGAYSAMLRQIRSYASAPFVYLCMESESVWRDVFNREYRNSDDLEDDFCRHLEKNFL